MLDKHFPIYIIVFISTLILTVLIERKLIPLLSKSLDLTSPVNPNTATKNFITHKGESPL